MFGRVGGLPKQVQEGERLEEPHEDTAGEESEGQATLGADR